jgi:hypothetical protein
MLGKCLTAAGFPDRGCKVSLRRIVSNGKRRGKKGGAASMWGIALEIQGPAAPKGFCWRRNGEQFGDQNKLSIYA